MTCRNVRPELLLNDEERRQAAWKSQLPEGHEQYEYDGDINSTMQTAVANSGPTPVQQATIEMLARIQAGDVTQADTEALQMLATSLQPVLASLRPSQAVNSETGVNAAMSIGAILNTTSSTAVSPAATNGMTNGVHVNPAALAAGFPAPAQL